MRAFSRYWKSSKKPKKQRKYLENAPLHIKHKFLSANLAKPLRTKYKLRNIPVRKGDKVKVMVGKFKKQLGKVDRVDLKKTRIYIEGLQAIKRDGTKVNVAIHPSNIQIQELNLDDKERRIKIESNIKVKG